jgi:hypothetical protein
MTKMNPLFVDSTKFQGDTIASQIELSDVFVYDDELVFVLMTNHLGVRSKSPMKRVTEWTFEARMHLNHQKTVAYQFVIEKEGAIVMQSAVHKSRAQYAIIEKWQPCLEPEAIEAAIAPLVKESLPPQRPPMPRRDANWPKEYSSSVKSLIDKWGL